MGKLWWVFRFGKHLRTGDGRSPPVSPVTFSLPESTPASHEVHGLNFISSQLRNHGLASYIIQPLSGSLFPLDTH